MVTQGIAPAFSVVIPLYNKERHVRRAIDSVLAQSVANFEIIVVDDGSTDDGAALARSIGDSRIRVIQQANGGVSAARNRGIDVARAPLVAFLDADDAYRPDFLANVSALTEKYPDAGAYALNFARADGRGEPKPAVTVVEQSDLLLTPTAFFRIARFGVPVHPSALVVKAATFASSGTFPVGVKLGEDIDTCLRICFVASIAFDRRVGATYFLDADHRALSIHPPPLHYPFFDTIDAWVARTPDADATLLENIREFKYFFVIAFAHHQIRWGSARLGRQALIRCETSTYRVQKWRWIAISFVPRALYRALVVGKALWAGRRGRSSRVAPTPSHRLIDENGGPHGH